MKIQNSSAVQVQSQKKDNQVKTFLKSNVAASAGSMAQVSVLPVSYFALNKMSKSAQKLSPAAVSIVNKSAQDMVNALGLDKCGVRIVDYRGKNLGPVSEQINKIMQKNNKLIEFLKEVQNPIYATGKGKNAFFALKGIPTICGANSVVLNQEKFSLAAFHEIGHAFNSNKSKVWSLLQKSRMPITVLASLVAMFPAFTRTSKPDEDGQELTKAQKIKNNLRNNAGKLAFATMIPVLAEEAMASIRGCKWANSNLPKELAKKVLTTNAYGMASYVLTAVGVALSAVVARKVKDKLVENKTA